jgi:hypothetical protein
MRKKQTEAIQWSLQSQALAGLTAKDNFALAALFGFPHQGRSPRHQNGEHTPEGGVFEKQLFGVLVFSLIAQGTVDQGKVLFLGKGVKAPTEVHRHLDQALLI